MEIVIYLCCGMLMVFLYLGELCSFIFHLQLSMAGHSSLKIPV